MACAMLFVHAEVQIHALEQCTEWREKAFVGIIGNVGTPCFTFPTVLLAILHVQRLWGKRGLGWCCGYAFLVNYHGLLRDWLEFGVSGYVPHDGWLRWISRLAYVGDRQLDTAKWFDTPRCVILMIIGFGATPLHFPSFFI